jgi:hypothetical protein
MNKNIKTIQEMIEKMIPIFQESWADEKQTRDFSFRTYRDGNRYSTIEFTLKDRKINLNYNGLNYNGEKINITQTLGKELSLNEISELIKKLFKTTFSFESMSSEEYSIIGKIKNENRNIIRSKKEIKKLNEHLEELNKQLKIKKGQ